MGSAGGGWLGPRHGGWAASGPAFPCFTTNSISSQPDHVELSQQRAQAALSQPCPIHPSSARQGTLSQAMSPQPCRPCDCCSCWNH